MGVLTGKSSAANPTAHLKGVHVTLRKLTHGFAPPLLRHGCSCGGHMFEVLQFYTRQSLLGNSIGADKAHFARTRNLKFLVGSSSNSWQHELLTGLGS